MAVTHMSKNERIAGPLYLTLCPRHATHHAGRPLAVAAANKFATLPTATALNEVWMGDITY